MFKPFLLSEALAINERATFRPDNVDRKFPILISDNLLADYHPMRTVLRDSYIPNWKIQEGGRNFVDYYDCRQLLPVHGIPLLHVIRQALRHFFQVETEFHGAAFSSNWFLQIGKRRSDFAVPHSDHDFGGGHIFTIIHYLNAPEECSGGTAFFRHKETGRIFLRGQERDAFYARYRHLGEDGSDYWLDRYASEWEAIGTVEMKAGRTLVFPAEFFHAAYQPDDRYIEYPRLTLAHWERAVAPPGA